MRARGGGSRPRRPAGGPALLALVAFAALVAPAASARSAAAQEAGDPEMLDVEATPIGALPPLALPMPASRNHNYWGFRLQLGNRAGRDGPDLMTVAGGVDLQWRGGSVFGLTAGYQRPDCADTDCDGHFLLGTRARFNVVTGGPTIASLFNDYSATSTLGAEVGFGYSPDAVDEADACTVDIGMPLSLAMLQKVRVSSFIMPSVAWDVACGSGLGPVRSNSIINAGLGVQQLLLDGLDIYLGVQKIFRNDTGYQVGISVVYVHLP
jgi:hypothetical protein